MREISLPGTLGSPPGASVAAPDIDTDGGTTSTLRNACTLTRTDYEE